MMTIREAVKWGAKRLRDNNVDNADHDSFELLSAINGMTRTFYLVNGDSMLSEENFLLYEEYIDKRAAHVPLQHILGKAYFYGYEFEVNEDVLIPRPDTEVLVGEVIKVTRNGDNIDFMLSDLFGELGNDITFNTIVSNPPYIRSDEIPHLMPEVSVFEPHEALDGSEDGLLFYRRIIKDCRANLKPQGRLLFEIGCDQGRQVSEMMQFAGFSDVHVIKDLAGNDRVVSGVFDSKEEKHV